jgi:hypothetical protein
MEIKAFGRALSDTPLDAGLRRLSKKIAIKILEEPQILPEKYGVDFANETFSIAKFPKHPNFIHVKTGYQVSWGLYIGVDIWTNQQLSFEQILDIFEDCHKSLKK